MRTTTDSSALGAKTARTAATKTAVGGGSADATSLAAATSSYNLRDRKAGEASTGTQSPERAGSAKSSETNQTLLLTDGLKHYRHNGGIAKFGEHKMMQKLSMQEVHMLFQHPCPIPHPHATPARIPRPPARILPRCTPCSLVVPKFPMVGHVSCGAEEATGLDDPQLQ